MASNWEVILTPFLSDLPNGTALAKCFFVEADKKFAVNQRICIWRSKGANQKFLFYILNRNKYFLGLDDGVSQTHILNHHIAKCKIPIPPTLAEQTAIASALSDADGLITSLEKLIAKKRNIKQGAMQELLRPKEGWGMTTLLDFSVDGLSNGVFNDPSKVGKGYRLINVLDLYRGFSIDTKNLTLLGLSPMVFARNKVKKGDVFFTRSSITPDGIAYCNFCNEAADDITFDGHIMKITPNPKIISSAYLRLYCISPEARKYLVGNAKQTTMTTIGQGEIAKLPILLPPLSDQYNITTILSDMDTEISTLAKKLEKAKQVMQGMMKQLLTGKIRLV